LQLGAFYDGHTAHLHGAPDHSGRIAPLVGRNPIDRASALPQFRFSGYAGHFRKKQISSLSVCVKSLGSQEKEKTPARRLRRNTENAGFTFLVSLRTLRLRSG
jgi:hypothetical protein